MSADKYAVETRKRHDLPWGAYVDRIEHELALSVAKDAKVTYPREQFRIVDLATGEVTHIGPSGLPLVEHVMVPDRRTGEQVMADLAGDRYEASLERGRDV